MAESSTNYRYATYLNVLYPPLEKMSLDPLVEAVTHPWYNQTLARVNESVIRLGVMQGEYHWHHHDDDDEFFLYWKDASSSTSNPPMTA